MNSFTCKICGACCKGDGSVFLYPGDIKKISEQFKLSIQETVDRYTEYIMLEIIENTGSYMYMPYLVLKKASGKCVFLNSNLCEINKFKPFQCSHTPFVAEFFADDEWRSSIKKSCQAVASMKESDYASYSEIGEKSEKAEKEYYYLLRENGFNLEKILSVSLKAPKMISSDE